MIESASTLEAFLHAGWEQARARIVAELVGRPTDHWLLAQLGATYYEQQQYAAALPHLLDALALVPDCPLTLWHIAGTLDALGKPAVAIRLYDWLLTSRKTPVDDPCWESAQWTADLKTDCVFRIGRLRAAWTRRLSRTVLPTIRRPAARRYERQLSAGGCGSAHS